MCVFKRLNLGGERVSAKCNINLCYIYEIYCLFKRYGRHLCDDFARVRRDLTILSVMELVMLYEPFFWVVLTKKGDFMGFVYLYDVIGGPKGGGVSLEYGAGPGGEPRPRDGIKYYSAAVTVCFKREFWGRYVRWALKKFKKYCFGRLGLKRVKAEVFARNARVKGVLAGLGFEREGVLRAETLCNGEPADVEVWGLVEKARL